MSTRVYDNGKYRDVFPFIFKEDDWGPSIPWVYSKGFWKRTFDPGFVNIINNSRLINGTDISVTQGNISGVPPVGWSLGTISSGSSYSVSEFTDREQVKSIRFVSDDSRHYYVTRVQVTGGNTYTASAYVDSINVRNSSKVIQIVGETAYVDIEVDFPSAQNIKVGLNSIQFYARTSGIIQLRIGAGCNQATDADVSISRPQITGSFDMLEWQPTPVIAPFYGVNLLDSYLIPDKLLTYTEGEYSIDCTLRIERDFNRPVMLFGRQESNGYNGIAFDLNNVYVYRSGSQYTKSSLSRELPKYRLFGLKVIWRKSGNYVSDIRFYLNGELLARIQSTLYTGNIDSIFGYSGNRTTNITIQNFALSLDKPHTFTVDEGEGNVISDINNTLSFQIQGDDSVNYHWINNSSPPIIITEPEDQKADLNSTTRIFADATFFITAQWYKNNEVYPGKTSPEIKFPSVTTDDYADYFCEFQNEYGKTRTRTVRLTSPDDTSEKLLTEDDFDLCTEDRIVLLTED